MKKVIPENSPVSAIPDPPQPPTPSRSQVVIKKIAIILGLVFIVSGTAGTAYYLGTKRAVPSQIPPPQQPQYSQVPSTFPTIAGSLTPSAFPTSISKTGTGGLDLINAGKASYYTVGKIQQGQYKGYKRIVAVIQQLGLGGPKTELFATDDDVHYILSGNPDDAIKYPETDENNPYYLVVKDKITAIADLSEVPESISIDTTFSLHRNGIYTELQPTGENDDHNNPEYEYMLPTNFSSYQPLSSHDQNFTFYYRISQTNSMTKNLLTGQENDKQIIEKYLAAETEVIVVDAQGLAYSYNLTTLAKEALYPAQKTKYDQEYYDFFIKHETNTILQSPTL